LAALCRSYWYPLYAFIRRQGYNTDQAQDLTQEFFARLLEKDFLQQVDSARGKFRSFLMAACKHFLSNERDRARTARRGGDHVLISLDFASAQQRYEREPVDTLTPEKLFERRWVLTLLDKVLAQLQEQCERVGKGLLFERLKAYLAGEKQAAPYGQVAAELGLSEGAVKVAVHRLRRRYRELLYQEIAHTLDEGGKVEEEIQALFAALDS
jgi:RNA polymerase sigma-70 factor (ECF subfamily)